MTWDKESWPDSVKYDVVPQLSADLYVAPSIRIVGFVGANLGYHPGAIVPAYQQDPGAIFMASGGAYSSGLDQPPVFIFSGALPRGTYNLYEAWDGVSGGYAASPNDVGEAGDIDGDGHLDFWDGTNLFLGPVLGRGIPPYVVHDGAFAWLDNGSYVQHVPGAYDGDGDGFNDLIITYGGEAYLGYGPFEGEIDTPVYGVPAPPEWTTFGALWCGAGGPADPVLLRNNLGPGHDAFVQGQCYDAVSGWIFDLQGPRGRVVPFLGAVGQVGDGLGFGRIVGDAGDLDGDGYGDLWINGTQLVAGPSDGDVELAPPLLSAPLYEYPGVAVGDLNGDGVSELLTYRVATDEKVLLFSPHSDPLDLDAGLVMARHWFEVSDWPYAPADVDGDGFGDLVLPYGPFLPDERGEVRIWFGPDLVAALGAQRRAQAAPAPAARAPVPAPPTPRRIAP